MSWDISSNSCSSLGWNSIFRRQGFSILRYYRWWFFRRNEYSIILKKDFLQAMANINERGEVPDSFQNRRALFSFIWFKKVVFYCFSWGSAKGNSKYFFFHSEYIIIHHLYTYISLVKICFSNTFLYTPSENSIF